MREERKLFLLHVIPMEKLKTCVTHLLAVALPRVKRPKCVEFCQKSDANVTFVVLCLLPVLSFSGFLNVCL